jgi:hypothetical protein
MEEVLKKNGIDKTAMFGHTVEGDGACKLMENREAICKGDGGSCLASTNKDYMDR